PPSRAASTTSARATARRPVTSASTRPRPSAASVSRARPTFRSTSSCSTSTARRDRKSTRLNSSHSQISYAVFCLKKKKTKKYLDPKNLQRPHNLFKPLTHLEQSAKYAPKRTESDYATPPAADP